MSWSSVQVPVCVRDHKKDSNYENKWCGSLSVPPLLLELNSPSGLDNNICDSIYDNSFLIERGELIMIRKSGKQM